ncbi:MAG: glycoside hydrolase family 3 protein, partial [Clostridiales bacterium]|nr:glycoside hydrolase family 3 protein [Clostridiales bacterium]
MVELKSNPYFLIETEIDWVNRTLDSMSMEEKIGQLFCPIGGNAEEKFLLDFLEEFQPGAMLYRPMPAAQVRSVHKFLQEHSRIPMLLAANLESGGNGICADGTYFARPMGVAATDRAENAYRLGAVSGREAQAVGCNWAFSPICDLDLNFRNPIMNVRTFGSDRERVISFVREQMRGLLEYGVAAAVKHFPGDGVDGRDQHLLSSVNSLSVEEWDDSYGRIWQSVVDAGALSVMVGHILQPAYSRYFNPALADEEILPAVLSTELLNGLLRGKLGFNGVIVTDATPMVGFAAAMPRKEAIPAALAAGCDMILFNKDIREDYQSVRDALADGRLTGERIDEAVTRILAMKAAMQLPEKQAEGTLVPPEEALSCISCAQHREWAKVCADESVTLVKDTQELLP